MLITDKDYKRWFNMSKVICNDKDIAADILQDLLINMLEKNISDQVVILDNYIFISLKNRFGNFIRSQKNKKKDEKYTDLTANDGTELLEDFTSPEDLELLIEKNIEDQHKIDIITMTVLKLPSHDMKLYQLHFIWGLSQREIAKRIGISHMTINMRVNRIKVKIRESYEKNK